ncbi:hypothetical protein Cadr_000011188 [Camelus dromedarius]|uniref:Uncharacterized protein n=1 Tax=Camelus dromedarius TaxID=9838 RepID=A0A5N4DSS7_CAMDR|nr:hypothetical protein Cadr_000011188 [Camelus dromedarius]
MPACDDLHHDRPNQPSIEQEGNHRDCRSEGHPPGPSSHLSHHTGDILLEQSSPAQPACGLPSGHPSLVAPRTTWSCGWGPPRLQLMVQPDVIAHLGQQAAQLSLSLKAPQPSRVGTGHVHDQVVGQGAQDANPLCIPTNSVNHCVGLLPADQEPACRLRLRSHLSSRLLAAGEHHMQSSAGTSEGEQGRKVVQGALRTVKRRKGRQEGRRANLLEGVHKEPKKEDSRGPTQPRRTPGKIQPLGQPEGQPGREPQGTDIGTSKGSPQKCMVFANKS